MRSNVEEIIQNIDSMRFQIFENFRKLRNLTEIKKFSKFEKIWLEREIYVWMKGHSTSPPCGNLVDDLPHDFHTESVAKPCRLGPAQNGELPPENDRIDKVLLDDLQENTKKAFSSVC